MARRKKIIQVPHGTVEKIVSVMGCSRAAVFNALAYRSDSENAKTIRAQALAYYGGIETTKLVL